MFLRFFVSPFFLKYFFKIPNLDLGSRAPTMVQILENVYLIFGPIQHKIYYYKKISNLYIFNSEFFSKRK